MGMYYKNNIKYLRESQGLSLNRLAEDLKLSRSVIGGYESGKTMPPLDKIELLATYFKVSVSDFLHKNLSIEDASSEVSEPDVKYEVSKQQAILIDQIGRLQKENNELRELIKKYTPELYEGEVSDN